MANLFLLSRKAFVMCYCFRAPIKTFFFDACQMTVKSCVLHLFPVPQTGRSINRWKKARSVIYSTDRKTRLIRGIYKKKFNDFKSNLKQTRQTLNEILSRLKYKTALPRDFINNGKVIRDPLVIANQFNKYFINVGPSLAKKLNGSS